MGDGWMAVRLGEVVQIKHGWPFKSPLFSAELTGRPIVVAIGNFNYSGGFRLDSTTVKEYRGEYPKDYELKPRDILVVMTCQTPGGEILGVPARVPNDDRVYLHNQRIGKVVVKDLSRIDRDFLYWVFLSPALNQHLVRTASGTKILHTAPSRIESFELRLPPLAEQRRIAGILGALNDKIELNRRMATTLEGLARAAYAELQATLSDECSAGSIADVAFNPRDQVDPRQVDPSTPYIGLEHVPRGRMVLGEWGQAVNAESGKMAFQRNDILFGKLRPYFRKVGVVPTSGICSTDILVIRARRPEDLGYVLAVATDAAFIEASNAASTGTRMPRTSWGDLVRYPLLIPPTSARAAFTKRVWPLIERAQAALFETGALERIRDTLLPRLLSGDIEVAA